MSFNTNTFVYRPLLTQFTIQAGTGMPGPARLMAPTVTHNKLSGQYGARNRDYLGGVDPRRAPGNDVPVRKNTKKGMESFSMMDHCEIVTVPEELVDGDEAIFEELQAAAVLAVKDIDLAWQRDVHEMTWATSEAGFQAIYGNNNVIIPAAKFDAENAPIRSVVRELATRIYKATGHYPNTMGITEELFNVITSDPDNEIGKTIRYTNGGVITEQILASYFGIANVFVIKNLEPSANAGQNEGNPAYDFMYTGNNIWMAYIDTSNSRFKSTFASTFVSSTPNSPFMGVQTRYNRDNKSYEAEVGAYWDTKIVIPECAGVLYNCLT